MTHADMSDEHAEIVALIESIQRSLEAHVKHDHAHIMERPEIEMMLSKAEAASSKAEAESRKAAAASDENKHKLSMLVDLWKGSIDPLTGERHEHEGIEHKLDVMQKGLSKIVKMTENGGVPAKVVTPHQFPRTDRTAIWTAAVGGILSAITLIVVAWLQYGP